MPLTQPYASLHHSSALAGPSDARPTATQILRDQNLIGALFPTFTILITGCTSGLGLETARALYLTGATIYITARDLARGRAVASQISTDSSRPPVQALELELDDFASVRSAAATFLERSGGRLNVLINNAGIMACPEGKTKDGLELQFGTNHLGHFLLFQLLKPALLGSASPSCPSRVVSLASTGHRYCPRLPLDDLNSQTSPYNPGVAYGISKLSNIYFATHLTRRYSSQHLHATSVHPGSIITPLRRHMQASPQAEAVMKDPEYLKQLKSTEQGAATTVWAAVGQEWKARGGVYLEDVGEAGPQEEGEGLSLFRPGFAEQAFGIPEDEKRLWEASLGLCGLGSEEEK